jgi:hypothetical protein
MTFLFNGSVVAGLIAGQNFGTIAVGQGARAVVNGTPVVGQSISMKNGILYVNGTEYHPDPADKAPYKAVEIRIEGNVDGNITTTAGNVTVTGSVKSVSTTSGDIRVDGRAC